MKNELHNLFLSVLLYLETADYKSANNLALELFDLNSSLINDVGFTKERIDSLVTKLLLFSIKENQNVTNLSAFQYVCFSMDNGISEIINLDSSYYRIINSVGVTNNLALAYFTSGDYQKALNLQKVAISNANDDSLLYGNQKDLIYFNELIYEISYNNTFNIDRKDRILNVLTSPDVYDFEYALLIAMVFNDYEYFCEHYNEYCLMIDFENEIKSLFCEYYKNQTRLNLVDYLKYLKPIAIYDELLYENEK